MVRGFYSELTAILKANGCYFKRQAKGDHEMWFSPITNRAITVDRGCLSRNTANAVLKQAGIDHKL